MIVRIPVMSPKLFLWLGVGLVLMLSGCEDKSIVNLYDKSLQKHPPKCLALTTVLQDASMEKAVRDRFHFDPKCLWRLVIDYKRNIQCTSNQNSERKALGAFPSSYLRMEIWHGMSVAYSYYIDVPRAANPDDIARAIARIKSDLYK